MSERVYPRAGLKGWLIAGVLSTLLLLPIGGVLTMFEDCLLNAGLYFLVTFPVAAFLSALMNWGYERQYNEEIFTRLYVHPATLFERVICVSGAAIMIAVFPFIFLFIGGLLLWLAML